MSQHNTQFNTQSGNVIIIIFIAVALFGALAFAFNQTSRTSTVFISDSAADATASRIIAYGNELKNAYKKIEIRGCDVMEISFENPVETGYINANAPASNKCHIFAPEGGNLEYDALNDEDIRFTDRHRLANFGCNGASLCTEILYALKDIDEKLCTALNEKIGIDGIPTDTNGAGALTKFNGAFTGSGTSIGEADTNLLGQPIACYLDSDDSEYIFYYNLKTR